MTTRHAATSTFCTATTSASFLERLPRCLTQHLSASILLRSISALSALRDLSEAFNASGQGERRGVTGEKPLVIYSLTVCGWGGCSAPVRHTHGYTRTRTACGISRSETSAPGADWLTRCSSARLTAVLVHKQSGLKPPTSRFNHVHVPIIFIWGCSVRCEPAEVGPQLVSRKPKTELIRLYYMIFVDCSRTVIDSVK